jgi:hypothetical protein
MISLRKAKKIAKRSLSGCCKEYVITIRTEEKLSDNPGDIRYTSRPVCTGCIKSPTNTVKQNKPRRKFLQSFFQMRSKMEVNKRWRQRKRLLIDKN